MTMTTMSPSRFSYGMFLLLFSLLWGGQFMVTKPLPGQGSYEPATVSGVAAETEAITTFLHNRLPPAVGKVELRFEDDDTEEEETADESEKEDDDREEPKHLTYAMASARNRLDRARVVRCHEHQQKRKEEGLEATMDISLPFPVYYINMDKSTERRQRMEKNFGHLWDLRRFPGVDGRNETLVKSLVAPEHYEAILPYLAEKRTNKKRIDETSTKEEKGEKGTNTSASPAGTKINPILRSELGASLAHLTAIRQAYLEGHERIMIAEDDLSPLLIPCWTSSLRDLINDAERTEWDLLQVGWLVVKNNSIYRRSAWGPEKRLIKQENQYGAAAYLISRTGMELIMDLFFTDRTSHGLAKVFTEPDSWGNIVVETYLGRLPNTHVAMPSLFIVDTFDTTIGNEKASVFRLQNWRISNNHHITATLELFDEVLGVPEEDECEDCHWDDETREGEKQEG